MPRLLTNKSLSAQVPPDSTILEEGFTETTRTEKVTASHVEDGLSLEKQADTSTWRNTSWRDKTRLACCKARCILSYVLPRQQRMSMNFCLKYWSRTEKHFPYKFYKYPPNEHFRNLMALPYTVPGRILNFVFLCNSLSCLIMDMTGKLRKIVEKKIKRN